MVVDLSRERVVILDSTLRRVTVIGDTSSTGTAPSVLAGAIPYLGDSTLVVHVEASAFLVVDARGTVVRSMALPRPRDVRQLLGGPYGTPGLDVRGRLIYRASARQRSLSSADGTRRVLPESDSAAVVRLDFKSRKIDTLAKVLIVKQDITESRTRDGRISLNIALEPMPMSDEWAVLSDGTVAVVRGRDYHVDWVAPDGKRWATPRVPYPWVRLTDAQKREYRDSVIVAFNKELLTNTPARDPRTGPRYTFAAAEKMSDYIPPFGNGTIRGGILRADPDDNLWIRTNTHVGGRPVYDVVNKQGALIDRVSLPFGRIIVGFGDKTVLMAVIDGTSVLLEVAKVR